jgi:hypothetical protein
MKRSIMMALTTAALALVVHPGLAQEPPTLRLTRDLRIDANDHDLSPVTFVAVAPNGSIAVNQQQDRHIRFFDATGKSLGKVGRSGQGPGEFMILGRMFWLNDTLVVVDGSTRRYTLIAPDRQFVRTVSTQVSMSMRPGASADTPRYPGTPFTLGTDGSFVLSVRIPAGSPAPPWPGGAKEGSPLVRVDSAGVFRNIIAWRPEIDCSAPFDAGRGGQGFAAIPFCPMLLQEFSPDGSRVALSWVEQGNQPAYRIAVFRVNGDTVFNRRFAYRPVRISQAVKDSVVASRSRNPQIAQALAKVQLPETYPPVTRFLLGADETTWIEFPQPDGDRKWEVLDARGTPIAELKVPRNVRIMVASRASVWAVETDDDGLQHVVRFRVSR